MNETPPAQTALDLILADRRIRTGDLARALGRSTRTIARWRAGTTRPGKSDILALAGLLDVPAAVLVSPATISVSSCPVKGEPL